MNTKHTPEPWAAPQIVNNSKDGEDFREWTEIENIADFYEYEDAQRAQACVNALAGLNPEAIQKTLHAFVELLKQCEGDTNLVAPSFFAFQEAHSALAKLHAK